MLLLAQGTVATDVYSSVVLGDMFAYYGTIA